MCRGQTDEPAEFRTQTAFELLAQHQRSKCRMYLLGLAEGLAQSERGDATCLPPIADREALSDRLVAAVLEGPGGAEIPEIVRGVLRSYDCG